MNEEEKENPSYITPVLCEAYRDVMMTKIDSIKNAVYLTGLILGLIISAWSILLLMGGMI